MRRASFPRRPARARLAAQRLAPHHHDFDHDPFARGAYSYLRPGGGEAHAELARPIDGTLFFAGEGTDVDYPGTVGGAIQSGERAAHELLQA
jgi:monoamine oxidase